MTKKFCPRCGNNTLLRTSITVDAEGNVTCYLKKNFQYRNRGTVFAIPTPKGGQRGNDMILREDQKEYAKAERAAKTQLKQTLLDSLDLDADLLGDRKRLGANVIIGHGRKNPNEVKGRRR
ncbi:Nin1 binding protein [Irineochytrium annulatum]|nr:Nin1 binding protein [Irineochytrium annulatum]